jgi:16S rRNA (guanine527-N7)-methyltransferase
MRKSQPQSRGGPEAARDRELALRLSPSLSRIKKELGIYDALLRRWQTTINLVSASTLSQLWTRHFADSAQIYEAFPAVRHWADLGSGAGFPGLVTALLLKGQDGAIVHLIESDQRKASFLRAVSRETGAPVEVHAGRIEAELAPLLGKVDGLSARALAPLPQLASWSRDHLENGAVGAFLKGEDWRSELTGLEAAGSFSCNVIVSRTSPEARLITLTRELQ